MIFSPLAALLGFAAWTLLLLVVTVGYYRWSNIFARALPITAFAVDDGSGPPWYRRAIRAHANCVESIGVFAVAVIVNVLVAPPSQAVTVLANVVLYARIVQSFSHVLLTPSTFAGWARFLPFLVQVLAIAGLVVTAAQGLLARGVVA